MIIEIPDGSINNLQRESIRHLLKDAKGMSRADIILRINGEERAYQVDWLKHTRILPNDDTD